MKRINIIGLGPGNINSLTLGAIEKIKSGNKNYLRTKEHPTVKYFHEKGIDYESYDHFYEEEDSFFDVYNSIVNDLVQNAKTYGEINYYVPGNPMIAEKTVELLLEEKEEDLDIEIISGMSFIEPLLELIEKDPIDGLKIIDGSDFRSTLLDINVDIIVTQTYNKRILSDLKLDLGEIYGDEHKVYVIHNAGIENKESYEYIPVYMLDRIDGIGNLSSIYIPKVPVENRALFDFNNLIDIMKLLRSDDGCSWDIKQTHESLRKELLEESYEFIEAINNEDIDGMIEELGDILLQVIFHSQIAYEDGIFNILDVTSSLGNKLINRHPHIFLKNKVVNRGEVVYNWDRVKNLERDIETIQEEIDYISKELPVLMRSVKVQNILAREGFDWNEKSEVLDKINEEYYELLEAIDLNDRDSIEDELGDVLFSFVNLSRFLDVDPEVALNRSLVKFEDRAIEMEKMSIKQGKKIVDMDMSELNQLWNLAKETIK